MAAEPSQSHPGRSLPRLAGLLKPCYVFAPHVLSRRICALLLRPQPGTARVKLPWGAVLEVNTRESIGHEILTQNIFDIAVSETAWRLLGAGDTAIDVGANIGYMTSLFASRVGVSGHVEAFEPHPRIFARLTANLTRGGERASVRLHELALGAANSSALLLEPSIFDGNEGSSSLSAAGRQFEKQAGFPVQVRTLDSFFPELDIGLLKLDVEGFEADVLAGAARLLAQHKIRDVIYEAHDCERSALHDILQKHGYTVFGIGHSLLGPRLSAGTAPPSIDRSWESPSYLATTQPARAVGLSRPRGWQVLRGRSR
jgi:FkbM family methyltransferase